LRGQHRHPFPSENLHDFSVLARSGVGNLELDSGALLADPEHVLAQSPEEVRELVCLLRLCLEHHIGLLELLLAEFPHKEDGLVSEGVEG
jgi:hypothetical protein